MERRNGDTQSPPVIILFDGVCNFCNASVDFVLRHDRKGRFRFAALQSAAGKAMLKELGLQDDYIKSVVLVERERYATGSTALLRVAWRLGFPWCLLAALLIIPPFLREPVYAFFARHRYRWFGRRRNCRVPTPEEQQRFL